MAKQRFWLCGLTMAAMLSMAACAKAPMDYKAPIAAKPPTGNVAVRQAVQILDASGSHEMAFAEGKSTLESVVGVMPNGNYSAGVINFGGHKREATGQSRFDRATLAAAAKNASFLQGATPIFAVFNEDLQNDVGGTDGRAAIVLISDGLATDYVGRSGADERTLEAARALVGSRNGETCFHTIQTGDDATGAALMRSLAGVSSCGSFRNASSLNSAAALEKFSREVYLGGAAAPTPKPAMKAAGVDSDLDGVMDSADACPNTLKSARVDSRGCWTLGGVLFETNSDLLAGGADAKFKQDLAVLRANPTARIRIDGYTDSDGSEAYNQALSERRAKAVRDYFVDEGGLDADRFEVKGFGEANPIVPNDSAANKRQNRRVELTIID